MLDDAYKAISLAEEWTYMKTDPGPGGYMFSPSNESIKAISAKIKYYGHSGASFALTMRSMQYLAIHGWDNYVTSYIKNDTYTDRIPNV
jgi:hypothetical protein